MVAFGQQSQHADDVGPVDGGELRGAQRGDGHRAGVVRVVLVHRTGIEQPNPGSEFGLDIDHSFASIGQLLGQPIPNPDAPSIAQVRCGQRAAQASNCSACPAEARTRTVPSATSRSSRAAAVCEALCGSIPITTVDDIQRSFASINC